MHIPLSPTRCQFFEGRGQGAMFYPCPPQKCPRALHMVAAQRMLLNELCPSRREKVIPTGLGQQGCSQIPRLGRDAERPAHLSLPAGELSKAGQEK